MISTPKQIWLSFFFHNFIKDVIWKPSTTFGRRPGENIWNTGGANHFVEFRLCLYEKMKTVLKISSSESENLVNN